MSSILLVDDDEAFGPLITQYLERFGYEVSWSQSLAQARSTFKQNPPEVAVVDMMLPDGSGIDLLEDCAASDIPAIVVTGHATIEHAVGSLRAHAVDFLVKPFKPEELKSRLDALLSHTEQGAGINRLTPDVEREDGLGAMIGLSPPMQTLFKEIRRVAPSEATVLLVGESGTGKELIAELLHGLSGHNNGPFIAVNCGAVAHELIASELFGHERGSFTGATRQHIGVFEQAAGGTLFLDEITEMPAELQVNLLRVLESGTFRRVGGKEDLRTNLRLVAATNRAPKTAIEEQMLREDLYFRLSEFPLLVPPLRERTGDVKVLAEHFLEQFSHRYDTVKTLTEEAYQRLDTYHWPGNVRELRNVIHGAYIVAEKSIDADDIERRIRLTSGDLGGSTNKIAPGLTIREVERQLIDSTLKHFDGNKQQAAKALGISLKTLYNRLNEYEAEEA